MNTNPIRMALYCTVATILLALSAKAHGAFTLDWDTIPPGSLANPEGFALGAGTVQIAFMDTQTPPAFIGGTPAVDNILNGTNGGPDTLHLQVEFTQKFNAVQMETSFIGYGPAVSDVVFTIFDIDKGMSPLPTQDEYWQDKVTVQGFLGAAEVAPTISGVNPALVKRDDNMLLGLSNFFPNDQPGAQATIEFNSGIDRFVLTYSDGDLAGDFPAQHGIGIGNISFEPHSIPEPSSLLVWGLVLSSCCLASVRRPRMTPRP